MAETAAPGPDKDKSAGPDWEAIERDFRAGVLSLREIAATHPGTNHVAIKRRADREGWTRDLRARIDARAEELVTRAAVTPSATETESVTAKSRKAEEALVVEANARLLADVQGGQKATAKRLHDLALALLAEQEGLAINPQDLVDLGELMRREDKDSQDKANDLYRKIISLPGRVDSAKKLAETIKIAIEMERRVYGLEKAEEGSKPGGTTGGVVYRANMPVRGSYDAAG